MSTNKMITQFCTVTKRKESVVVVLSGTKVLSEDKIGIAPLANALKGVEADSNSTHEVLVLIILDTDGSILSTSSSPQNVRVCCIGDYNPWGKDKNGNSYQSDEKDYRNFLRQEKLKRQAQYRQILRPYRDSCRSKGVAFEVKFAAGNQLQNLIVEEANIAKASRIVMDSCLATNMRFQFKGTTCKVSHVTEDKAILVHVHMHRIDGSKRSAAILESSASYSPHHPDTPISSTSSKNDNMESIMTEKSSNHVSILEGDYTLEEISEASLLQYGPIQLSRDVIMAIAQGFKKGSGREDTCALQIGCLPRFRSGVLVMKYEDDSDKVLRAEKRAAMTMHHRNIFPLVGYNKNEDTTYLVFPYARRLDQYLFGSREKKVKTLTFSEKLKIAIEVAQGLRYMHEECPNGPVIHGSIRPSNIFLKEEELQPQDQISGFAQSTWLHSEQTCSHRSEDTSDGNLLHLNDILCFGILLLRLFCQKPIPQDDKKLIEWARPLMIEHKFHEIFGEHTDDVNIHEVFRVLCTATQCTQTVPNLRPQMSEVLGYLKGETFCCLREYPPYRDG